MTDSDNLDLKKRARRRLVGAAALALLAAIVLPMVMDQEPGAPAQDIQVTIPDRDADSALARPIAGREDGAGEPQIAPPPEEVAPSAVVDATPGLRAAADPIVDKAAVDSAKTQPQPESKPEAKPEAKAESKPEAKPVIDDAARARALLEAKPLPSAAGEAFVVQVGAFGEAGKAGTVSAELKKQGFAAYTERAGSVTRVRVGPFPSRDEAERVAGRLRATGAEGVVVPR